MEKKIDFDITSAKLDLKQKDEVLISLAAAPNPLKLEANDATQQERERSIDLNDLSSFNMRKRKNEKVKNESKNGLINFEDLNNSNSITHKNNISYKNIKKINNNNNNNNTNNKNIDYFEDSDDFNLFCISNNNVITKNENLNENFNLNNTNYDSTSYKASITNSNIATNNNNNNLQEELFEKVLDNIKYKKKKKPCKKAASAAEAENATEAEISEKRKSECNNNALLTAENSFSAASNELNSEKLKREFHNKRSSDTLKAGLSTHITRERSSDEANNKLNIQLMQQKSFRDILKGESEETSNNNLLHNLINNKNLIKNNKKNNNKNKSCNFKKENYCSNNQFLTEANDEDDFHRQTLGKFNLLEGLDDLDFENLNENLNEEQNNFNSKIDKNSNYSNACDRANVKDISFLKRSSSSNRKVENLKNKNSSATTGSLDFNSTNNNNSFYQKINNNVKDKLFKNKKEQIQRNIEKEKIKNAKIFYLNFEQQAKPNSELSHTLCENFSSNSNRISDADGLKKNNEGLFSSIIHQKQNRNNNIFKSLNSGGIADCFRKELNKENKNSVSSRNNLNATKIKTKTKMNSHNFNHSFLPEEANFNFGENYDTTTISEIKNVGGKQLDRKQQQINGNYQSSNFFATKKDSE